MTSYRFLKFKKFLPWSWKSTTGFGFSDSARLAMSKSISKTAQSTAVLILLLNWENGHLPYWNYLIWPVDRHRYWHFALTHLETLALPCQPVIAITRFLCVQRLMLPFLLCIFIHIMILLLAFNTFICIHILMCMWNFLIFFVNWYSAMYALHTYYSEKLCSITCRWRAHIDMYIGWNLHRRYLLYKYSTKHQK